MNDIFNEVMVKKDISAWRWFFDVLLVFTAINIVILSLIYLYLFAIIPILAVLIGVPWLIRRRYIEFEYVLTNDQLDLEKIIGKRRRKQLYSIDVRHIELMAPMTVDFKDDFYKAQSNKMVDLASNSRAPGRWFIVFNSPKDGRVCAVFEPTVKMVRNIYTYAPRKVLGMDYLDEALKNGEML